MILINSMRVGGGRAGDPLSGATFYPDRTTMLTRAGSPPPGRQHDLDVRALGDYLRRADPDLLGSGALVATRLAGGRSNLTYLVTGGPQEFVLRRPPLGALSSHAHNIAREYRTMESLGKQGVCVPALFHLCDDVSVIGAPFMLMQRVPGRVLREPDDVNGLSMNNRQRLCAELVTLLVQLHSVEASTVIDNADERGAAFVQRQVSRWTQQWMSWKTRELPAVDELADRLAAAVPKPARVTVVHGDFRFDNVMFDERLMHPTAILDWELSSVGDPLTDLGLLISYWAADGKLADLLAHKRLTQALGVDSNDIAASYAVATGSALDDLDYYVALGYFKWAVIREGVYRRQLDGTMPEEDSSALRASVEIIAHQGLETAAGIGSITLRS
jgi:aminoglycoside phosphotransferase (APT) family kinase protein